MELYASQQRDVNLRVLANCCVWNSATHNSLTVYCDWCTVCIVPVELYTSRNIRSANSRGIIIFGFFHIFYHVCVHIMNTSNVAAYDNDDVIDVTAPLQLLVTNSLCHEPLFEKLFDCEVSQYHSAQWKHDSCARSSYCGSVWHKRAWSSHPAKPIAFGWRRRKFTMVSVIGENFTCEYLNGRPRLVADRSHVVGGQHEAEMSSVSQLQLERVSDAGRASSPVARPSGKAVYTWKTDRQMKKSNLIGSRRRNCDRNTATALRKREETLECVI